jgi:hypothetical protein
MRPPRATPTPAAKAGAHLLALLGNGWSSELLVVGGAANALWKPTGELSLRAGATSTNNDDAIGCSL